MEIRLDNAKDTIAKMTVQIEEFRAKAEVDQVTLKLFFGEADSNIALLFFSLKPTQNNLKSVQDHISNLEENINLMKRKEEEALLSLAENKLHVHQELEAKESQIKTLLKKIADVNEEMKKMKTSECLIESTIIF